MTASSRLKLLSKRGVLCVAGVLFAKWTLQLFLPSRSWLSVQHPNAGSIPFACVSHFNEPRFDPVGPFTINAAKNYTTLIPSRLSRKRGCGCSVIEPFL